MIKFKNEQAASLEIAQAMKSGDEKQMAQAWKNFHDSIAQQIKDDFAEVNASNDAAILAQRGYRQLTKQETNFYNALIQGMKTGDMKQAFIENVIDTGTGETNADDKLGIMPETIVEDVYRNLRETHPLLSKINMQYVGYSTKWVVNDSTAQLAKWGNITDSIDKEIKGALKVIDIDQNKLSCYCFIEKGMLDLGPTFLDGYIRAILKEAMANGLEYGVVKGTGYKEPIGLIRDIHAGVSFTTGTGYPEKTTGQGKYSATSFETADYGKLVSYLAKTEKGATRSFNHVVLVCNLVDYLTKVMPATTVRTPQGTYVNDVFPFPTDVVVSNQVDTGEAIMFVEDEYKLFAGGQRGQVIEYSDDYKFIEDLRYFKVKQYADGRAFDNTSAILLDISNLEPTYTTVKIADQPISTTVEGTVATQTTPAA